MRLALEKSLFALKTKYPMHARDGQNQLPDISRASWKGRLELDAGEAGSVDRKVLQAGSQKRLDTVSVFLQLSKYEEARPSVGYAIGGPFCGPGRGTPPGNSPAAALGSSQRIDRGRSSGRTGYSCFDAFAPSGKVEASGAG